MPNQTKNPKKVINYYDPEHDLEKPRPQNEGESGDKFSCVVESQVSSDDIAELYNVLLDTINLGDGVIKIDDIKNGGFQLIKNEMPVLKVSSKGTLVIRSPMEDALVKEDWLSVILNTLSKNGTQDIIVRKCKSSDAIKLAKAAAKEGCVAHLVFKEDVLVALEKEDPNIRNILKEILGRNDISTNSLHTRPKI